MEESNGLSETKTKKILGDNFQWPKNLRSSESYRRLHDDHDGTYEGDLTVTIGPDGDTWIDAHNPRTLSSLRFRNYFGGGQSLLVTNALILLADAIRIENEEHPQSRRPKPESEEDDLQLTANDQGELLKLVGMHIRASRKYNAISCTDISGMTPEEIGAINAKFKTVRTEMHAARYRLDEWLSKVARPS
jgi:hypothetical protein